MASPGAAVTVKFQVRVSGEDLNVEMTIDGNVDITNKNLEYEQALEALSGKETPATRVYRRLTNEPIEFFMYYASRIYANNEALLLAFAIDCLEHVLYVYTEEIGDDFLVKTIAKLRLNISDLFHGSNHDSKAAWWTLKEIEEKYRTLPTPTSRRSAGLVLLSANEIASGLSEASMGIYFTVDVVENSIGWSRQAASFKETRGEYRIESPELEIARAKEYNWQSRRLLHLMEAQQSGRSFLDIGKTP